jgi:hypothetical protein
MKNLITTIICTTFLFGCNKTKTAVLPPATTTGANTFGCKVNGVVCATSQYNHNTGFGTGEGVSFAGWFTDNDLSIFAHTFNPEFDFAIDINYDGKTGTYYSNGESLFKSVISDNSNGSSTGLNSNVYKTDSLNLGVFNITKFNIVEDHVAGTFNIRAINKNGDIINITEGRFDIKKPK